MKARTTLATAVAAVTLAWLPAAAAGHAVLERTSPERGAALAHPPAAVELRFNEPVEASFGAVRVFDGRGEEVAGETFRPDSRSDSIGTRLPDGLADGTYTATYRVVSADSHPVSGGFVFTVGSGGPASGATVSELLAGSEAGPVTEAAFGVARAVTYAATAVAVGGLVFGLLAFGPALRRTIAGEDRSLVARRGFDRRRDLLVAGAAGAGLVAGAAGIVLQGATATGSSFSEALNRDVVEAVLETRFGAVWALREGAWVVLGMGLLLRGPARAVVLASAGACLVAAPALAGHATTQSPVWALAPADVVHVAAVSVWAGGIAMLLWPLRGATRELEPAGRTRLLAATLARFSPIALAMVALVAATGSLQAVLHLEAPADLVETAFGRAVAVKVALLTLLIGLGARQRRRVIPRLEAAAAAAEPPAGAGRLARRTLRAEAALLAAVLGVTAALVSYAPPTALSAGPRNATAEAAGIRADLTVDPATPGSNEVHLYLLDAADGTPYAGLRGVAVEASLPAEEVGPIPLELERAGPGHYVAPAAALGIPGEWSLVISGRLSRFEEARIAAEIEIG